MNPFRDALTSLSLLVQAAVLFLILSIFVFGPQIWKNESPFADLPTTLTTIENLVLTIFVSFCVALLADTWKKSTDALKNSASNTKFIMENTDFIKENAKSSAANRSAIKEISDRFAFVEQEVDRLKREEELLQPIHRMLKETENHQKVLGKLMEELLVKRDRYWIPNSSRTDYWDLLMSAIEHSNLYYGIRWGRLEKMVEDNHFHQGEGADYLQKLEQKSMSQKIRVFVVEDGDIDAMRIDANNRTCVQNYMALGRTSTGGETDLATDIETFWIKSSDIKDVLEIDGVPKDCAIYDKELQIEFLDHEKPGILIFSKIDWERSDSVEARIFKKFDYFYGRHMQNNPFNRIQLCDAQPNVA